MDITLIDTETRVPFPGKILLTNHSEMPKKQAGWSFSWKQLSRVEGGTCYKIILSSQPNEIQGLLMLTVMFREMIVMNNIEVAPHNYGSQGKYDRVAGVLLGYACWQSFMKGKGDYQGFMTFESKTALIPFYQLKYGATHIRGSKMYIGPDAGRKLIQEYLHISFDVE